MDTARNRTGLLLLAAALATHATAQWQRQAPVPRPAAHQPNTIAFAGARGFVTGPNNFPFGEHVLASTDAGRTWHEQLRANVTTVHFADAAHGWMIGDGAAFRTDDGGQTWLPMAAFPPTSYWSLRARDASFVWAAHTPWASGYPLQISHDGGLSWSDAFAGGQELRIADFGSGLDGVAWGPAGLAFSRDGGASWTLAGPGSVDDVQDVRMLDATTALAIRDAGMVQPGEILRSTDGGRTWSVVHARQGLGLGDSLVPLGGGVVLAHAGITVLRSTDAGATWAPVALGGVQGVSYSAIVGFPGGLVLASSAHGEILRSADAGASWQQVFDGYGGPLSDFAFADATTGCAVGNYGAMLRTADAGLTWRWVSSGLTLTNLDLAMWDRARGIGVVDQGFQVVQDDRATWRPQPYTSGNQQTDVAVCVLPGGFAVTVGERGGLVHVSRDYGRTWTARTPTGGALHDVVFLTEQLGWAVGDALRIEHTADGGQSWTTQHTIPSRHVLGTIVMLDARHGFAAGTGGSLLATADGATWRPVPINLPHHGATQTLQCDFTSPDDGFLCGRFGFVATTADGGQTWTDRSLPGFDDDATAIRAVSATEACMAVTNRISLQSRLLHTTDAGRTWSIAWSGDDAVTHIERSPAGELWLCGTRGMILRRDPDGAWIAFGDGCAGSAGVPALAALAAPRLAQAWPLRATGLAAQASVAVLLVGGSRTAWGSVPLPLDLSPLGMPGCALRVAPDVLVGTGAAQGQAAWTLPVPVDGSLLGKALHLQALAPDPAANPAGLALANAGTGWIGR